MVQLWKDKVRVNEYNYDREDYKVDFKRKNVSIILYDEEAYIKNITIPIVNSRKLSTLIKYEIGMNFKNLENISYWFKIRKKYDEKMDITIYCINYKNEKILRDITSLGNRIVSINLYQFVEMQNVLSFAREEHYVISIYNSNYLYYIYLNNGIAICNSTVSNILNCEKQVIDNLKIFLEHYLRGKVKISKAYLINMNNCNFIQQLKGVELIKVSESK